MTTATTTRARRDDAEMIRYAVIGEAGATSYSKLHSGAPLAIEHHHRRPFAEPGQEPWPCSVLGSVCYPDGTSLWAQKLHREWLDAGCDDEVIWADLETRYAGMAGEGE